MERISVLLLSISLPSGQRVGRMQKVAVVYLILVATVIAVSGACVSKTYTTKLVPACDVNDLRIKWPNYEDPSAFYYCLGVNNALLIACPVGQVFVYVLQVCKTCDQYIPPRECEKLPTQNPPVCVAIGDDEGGENGSGVENGATGGYPTTHYRSTTTTAASNGESTTEVAEENPTSPTDAPSENPTNTPFPAPPTPQPTNVPLPSSAWPTSPLIEGPPHAS